MYYNIHCHKSDTTSGVSEVINLDLYNKIQLKKNEHYSIGIHPWYINSNINQLDIIEKNISSDKIIALGEIGLDKKCTTPFPTQLIFFDEQIKIAESAGKPIIIHCVKAYQEIIQHRKNSSVPWIIHGFNGTAELANQLISKNIYLSFGKTLLNKNSKSYKSFLHIPLESIFFETDIYDTDIREIYKQAAKLKNISIDNIIKQIEINFKKVFKVE
jgi:TatD DNase family protein